MNILISLMFDALISYLIGSFNFAIIFSKLFKQQDVREYGSKNAGMTNVIRVYGPKAGIPVFLGDFFKAILAIYLCNFLFKDVEQFNFYGLLISGFFVVLGHLYPLYFNFRGGKGIATSAGFILMQDIKFFIVVVLVFIIALMLFKVIAIASICSAVSYPIATLIFFQNYLVFIFSLIISLIVIHAHRSNIKKYIR